MSACIVAAWHDHFLSSVLPAVEVCARIRFRTLPQIEREEATAEAIAAALISFVNLLRRDQNPVEFAGSLARIAVLRVIAGRLLLMTSTTEPARTPAMKAVVRANFSYQPVRGSRGVKVHWSMSGLDLNVDGDTLPARPRQFDSDREYCRRKSGCQLGNLFCQRHGVRRIPAFPRMLALNLNRYLPVRAAATHGFENAIGSLFSAVAGENDSEVNIRHGSIPDSKKSTTRTVQRRTFFPDSAADSIGETESPIREYRTRNFWRKEPRVE
jgi:hypothetical protein